MPGRRQFLVLLSGYFSVGSYINGKRVVWYQLKIGLPMFQLNASVIIMPILNWYRELHVGLFSVQSYTHCDIKLSITQFMVCFHEVQGTYMFTCEGVCILVLPLSPDPTPPVESQSQFGEPVPPISFVQDITCTCHNAPHEV